MFMRNPMYKSLNELKSYFSYVQFHKTRGGYKNTHIRRSKCQCVTYKHILQPRTEEKCYKNTRVGIFNVTLGVHGLDKANIQTCMHTGMHASTHTGKHRHAHIHTLKCGHWVFIQHALIWIKFSVINSLKKVTCECQLTLMWTMW